MKQKTGKKLLGVLLALAMVVWHKAASLLRLAQNDLSCAITPPVQAARKGKQHETEKNRIPRPRGRADAGAAPGAGGRRLNKEAQAQKEREPMNRKPNILAAFLVLALALLLAACGAGGAYSNGASGTGRSVREN